MALSQNVRALAGVAVFLAVTGSEQAQAQNWDGSGLVRFGVFLQGSSLNYDITQTTAVNSLRQTASPDGLGIGISAGYDMRLGSFVIGGEIDGSFDDGGSKAKPYTNEQYGIDYFATARGRLGVNINPSLMVYATAGYAALGIEYKRNGIAVTASSSDKKYGTAGGFIYGGGVEYDIGWGIGFFEYLHTDTSTWDFTTFTGAKNTVDASQDVFRLGMKFKVGQDRSRHRPAHRSPAPYWQIPPSSPTWQRLGSPDRA